MSRFLTYTFPAVDTQDVCLTHDAGGAGNLTLNGNLVDKTTNSLNFLKYGYSRQLSCTTTQANNVVFTINGIQNGVNISDTVTVNNSTEYSPKIYDSVTSISIDRDATGVSVGTGWQGFFPLIGINLEKTVISYTLTLAQAAGGNIPYSVYGTLSNITNNGRTYLDNVGNNHNLIQIQAFEAENNYVYSYTGNLYSSILVYLGQTAATRNYSTQLNFIQI